MYNGALWVLYNATQLLGKCVHYIIPKRQLELVGQGYSWYNNDEVMYY